MIRRLGLTLFAVGLTISPAFAQTMGVAVQVSNGKRVPTVQQFQTTLAPGSFVRDILGWHKADPTCDLAANPSRKIVIPGAMKTLYKNVAAAGMKNFVTLAFNNRKCGQKTISGAKAFPNTPAQRAEFAAYAAEVVRRVPALGGLSLWNEINGTWYGGYQNQAQQLTDYCLLANAVITEVRKVDTRIPIAIGATVGTGIDDWFIEMFNKRGCRGKNDPTIWLDVHPYLSGDKVAGTNKTDWQVWRDNVSNIRDAGINNPLIATEWGAKAAKLWSDDHPNGNYMTTFRSQVLSQDPGWAGATWYEMLYDIRTPNAGLFDQANSLTPFGEDYIGAFGP